MAADTDPVVSAHGVEAVGTADEDQVIVSGNQHFDEVVALVLKRYNVTKHFEQQLKNLAVSTLVSFPVGVKEPKSMIFFFFFKYILCVFP